MSLKRLPNFRTSMVRIALAFSVFANVSHAMDFFVTSVSEINTAMQSAGPGDTVTMANGTWTNQTINFSSSINGNSTNQITLRAETPGQVILDGSSTLNISGDWLTVDGLRFEGGSLNNGSNAIVEFRGSNGEANNSRFTNSAIINYNAADVDDRYHWLELFGQNNRVDNNRFEGQNHSGVTVVVRRDDAAAQNHQIDQNHFVDRPAPINPSSSNGFETIRIGTSNTSLSDSRTTVENNLFERTDGEIEIISNKSGENTFQFNTFRESAGTLTLRHGNDNRVEGNFFLGENKDRSGGIRVIGERQTIVNNYIANVDDRAGGAISLAAGQTGAPPEGHAPVIDPVIAHNTVVNVLGPAVIFDDGVSGTRSTLPANVTFANNLLRSSGPTIFEGNEGTVTPWTWEGNIAFGGSLGPKSGDAGISNVDPQLQLGSDGLWRPNGGPAIDGGVNGYSGLVTHDMDGQARIDLSPDIGADEFSVATIVRKPLVSNDVGPAWLITDPPIDPPSGGGCFANGCAIQAEDYTSIVDPDNDGIVWTTNSVTEALGGEVLVSPGGSTSSSSSHETIATYDLTFEQAGTYRAYYRARGADGSSDSIFVPDEFAMDPTISEDLCEVDESQCNQNGFRWEVGGLFDIQQSDVGMPLEFRIGRREKAAEFDAFVLDLDLSLSPTELDDLFTVIFDPADFDEDGDVDADDLLAWQAGFGSTTGAAHGDGDADEDGDVDGNDFLAWQRQFTGAAATNTLAAQVPEPTTGLLILLGVTSSLTQLRNRKTAQLF